MNLSYGVPLCANRSDTTLLRNIYELIGVLKMACTIVGMSPSRKIVATCGLDTQPEPWLP